MPHLLIAGATGSGKSVGVNGIIASLLYAGPRDVKFVIVDPKKIELSLYKALRNHFLLVSPEAGEEIVTTPQFAVACSQSSLRSKWKSVMTALQKLPFVRLPIII